MAFTRYQVLLSVVMVITGSINTLSTKWVDYLKAVGSDGGEARPFHHPFVQACVMFLGEILCLLLFKILCIYYTRRQVIIEDVDIIRGNQVFNPLIFLPPAIFDMISTSLMYIGLELTYASSFQMLRGSVIVFVALLSVGFVNRKLKRNQWAGIVFIILGLGVVGFCDFTTKTETSDTKGVITGDLLIIIAQVITACQMVYEEKYVVDHDIPPLHAVGWEGALGFLVLSLLLIPFYYIQVPRKFGVNGRLEDVPDAFVQMASNPWIIVSLLGSMISIAFFNFAGITMTKEVSATTRMVLDSVRTFFIWMFSLCVHWQQFHVLQLLGFSFLLLGLLIYYEFIFKTPGRLHITRISGSGSVETCSIDDPFSEDSS